MDEQQAAAWLSGQRFQPYLDDAEGDHRRAVAIYEWHVRLSAACFAAINGFEVLLRNAVDRQLGIDQPQAPIGPFRRFAIAWRITTASRTSRFASATRR
ncbi:MAG: hypothetical protein ACYCUM_12475 [Solirubrobacteraceae bacterium]